MTIKPLSLVKFQREKIILGKRRKLCTWVAYEKILKISEKESLKTPLEIMEFFL
jgi:hypothetical protein